MIITFEIELDYGPDGPSENEPSPTPEDIEKAVIKGLEAEGFTFENVSAWRQD